MRRQTEVNAKKIRRNQNSGNKRSGLKKKKNNEGLGSCSHFPLERPLALPRSCTPYAFFLCLSCFSPSRLPCLCCNGKAGFRAAALQPPAAPRTPSRPVASSPVVTSVCHIPQRLFVTQHDLCLPNRTSQRPRRRLPWHAGTVAVTATVTWRVALIWMHSLLVHSVCAWTYCCET